MENIVFIDTEVGITDNKIHDVGALFANGNILHTGNPNDLCDFIGDTRFVCGHNIIHHDLKYIRSTINQYLDVVPIDTLYLSPLLFPKRPYHALLKDDKLQSEEMNNPVNDCKKAMSLFYDEISAFQKLPEQLKEIYYYLLHDFEEFSGFFEFLHYSPSVLSGRRIFGWLRNKDLGIKDFFVGRICSHADIETLINDSPIELSYALALINAGDSLSIAPPWTLKHYPKIYNIIVLLKNHPCEEGCQY